MKMLHIFFYNKLYVQIFTPFQMFFQMLLFVH
jgi:hypothetical protein